MKIHLTPGKLTLAELRSANENNLELEIDSSAIKAINASSEYVQQIVEDDKTVYGVNTGFGLLANTKIPKHQLDDLQRRIVLSHSAGVGEYFADETVRLIMLLKINSLSRGFSGIRYEVIDALVKLLNASMYPCIPSQGSVGASGDLAPLAHMSLALLGEGKVRCDDKIISGADALSKIGLKPLVLRAKEGLALLNGTQVSTALALQGLFLAEDSYAAASVIGSLTTEAILGSRKPFDEKIHEVRGLKSQVNAAKIFRDLLTETSDFAVSHLNCEKVQDPYSIRCQPQVMGACLNQIQNAAETLLCEANGVTDNPLIFTDADDVISGGNFHAEPIAMLADNLALAISEIGALSERRMAMLVDKHLSQLPAFLVDNGGINSGFMIAQVTSAALASENKCLANPSSVDSLPTSANQEDHVSMATYAARRLSQMGNNTIAILSIEYLAAVQGLDFRKPLKTSEKLEIARKILRDKVKFYEEDRYFHADIEDAIAIINSKQLNKLVLEEYFPSF